MSALSLNHMGRGIQFKSSLKHLAGSLISNCLVSTVHKSVHYGLVAFLNNKEPKVQGTSVG